MRSRTNNHIVQYATYSPVGDQDWETLKIPRVKMAKKPFKELKLSYAQRNSNLKLSIPKCHIKFLVDI